MLESQFGSAEAARIRHPVLCIEGGAQPPHLTSMSRQISERTVELLPQAEVIIIPGANHALPLQDPEAAAKAIASFIDARSVPREARRLTTGVADEDQVPRFVTLCNRP